MTLRRFASPCSLWTSVWCLAPVLLFARALPSCVALSSPGTLTESPRASSLICLVSASSSFSTASLLPRPGASCCSTCPLFCPHRCSPSLDADSASAFMSALSPDAITASPQMTTLPVLVAPLATFPTLPFGLASAPLARVPRRSPTSSSCSSRSQGTDLCPPASGPLNKSTKASPPPTIHPHSALLFKIKAQDSTSRCSTSSSCSVTSTWTLQDIKTWHSASAKVGMASVPCGSSVLRGCFHALSSFDESRPTSHILHSDYFACSTPWLTRSLGTTLSAVHVWLPPSPEVVGLHS